MSWNPQDGWRPNGPVKIGRKYLPIACAQERCVGLEILYERVSWLRWLIMLELTLSGSILVLIGRMAGLW